LSERLIDKTTLITLVILNHIKDVIQGKASVGTKRSSKWPTVRKNHLKKFPTCAVCGGTEKLEVHHVKPFHESPELELDPNNLVTLCESKSKGIVCHLFVGHLGHYQKINPTAVQDAAYWFKKLQ
jgi:5-methylcytosine-specific restriction protein A